MTQQGAQNAEGQPPRRRRWYLRWWAFLFHIPMGLMLALVLGWLIWLWVATSQRNAALAQLRAAGIPTSFQEHLQGLSPLPESVNPGIDYLAAIALIDTSAPNFVAFKEWQVPEAAMTPEERLQWLELQAGLVTEQQQAIERVRLADFKIRPTVDLVQADFGVWRALQVQIAAGNKPQDPIAIALPSLNDVRTLAKLLAADARTAAGAGDGERALRQVVRLIGLADAVSADPHTLVEQLVATGIYALTANAAIDVSASGAELPEGLAADLVGLLLDDEKSMQNYAHGIRSEAAFQFETMQALDDGRISIVSGGAAESHAGRILGFLTKPILRGDTAQIAEFMQRWYSTADAADWPSAADMLPPVNEMSVLDLYSSILLPTLDRATEAQFRYRTDCALAAAALAIARYRSDHAGEWPESLAVLVPQYLPRLPQDAMARAGVLQYDPKRMLLWSVGVDRVDDGGDVTSTRSNGGMASRWDGKDAVVELE